MESEVRWTLGFITISSLDFYKCSEFDLAAAAAAGPGRSGYIEMRGMTQGENKINESK